MALVIDFQQFCPVELFLRNPVDVLDNEDVDMGSDHSFENTRNH